MEHNPGSALHALEMISHILLIWMAGLYAIKIYLLLKKPPAPERSELKGDRTAGAIQSMFNVLMPWSMESTRNHTYFYIEFMIFHVAVAITIGSTFLIPFTPGLLTPGVVTVFMIFQGLAVLIGLRRMYRRAFSEEIRIISTPDDWFAVILMTVFFAVSFMNNWAWMNGQDKSIWMWLFFLMVCFFLVYVPFSKISHYVLYPFGRWLYGQIFGGRGVLNQNNPNMTWKP